MRMFFVVVVFQITFFFFFNCKQLTDTLTEMALTSTSVGKGQFFHFELCFHGF